ncbi:MAG: [NiFe]-hydrogenase assembly chaperone HybE [Caulobacterales bacterium]|nr:[NiFe]-hydrogenase assembly chaperone HybE [Caulobacterales bacterium]
MSAPGVFETHGLSGLAGLPPDTRFECGVCWRVYDPREGDDYWQVAPNTSFADLPDHWTCPNCDTPREKFVPLHRDESALKDRLAALEADYAGAAEVMRSAGAFNGALEVETLGFRPWGEEWIGVVISPWFMNVTVIPRERGAYDAHAPGSESARTLPSGEYDFIHARLDTAGAVMTCSLFSPMDDFADQEAARDTALAAMAALFNANIDAIAEEPGGSSAPAAPDRRALLFGGAREAGGDA